MDIKKLAKISDSFHSDEAKLLIEKKKDSRKKMKMQNLRKKLMDTESTEDAVAVAVEALKDEDPETVLTTVVETLGDVVTSLEETADSLKKQASVTKKADKKSSKLAKIKFKKKLMDTESTDEVLEEAKAALQVMPPVDVVETVIEVLDDVINNISEPTE
jgi:leucyl aminopeptidase